MPTTKSPVETWILALGGTGIVVGLVRTADVQLTSWRGRSCLSPVHDLDDYPAHMRTQISLPSMTRVSTQPHRCIFRQPGATRSFVCWV